MKNKKEQRCWITLGLPGSGKTFWAKQYVESAKLRGETITRVNNDDIRDELNGGPMDHTNWTPKFEDKVRKLRFERITAALKSGYDVIVDNTHLNIKTLNNLKTWLKQNFPYVFIEEKDFRHVSIQECLDRDAARIEMGERGTGPEVILKMAKEAGLIPEVEPYPIDWSLPWTIVCDLDGTLALFGKRRNAYDCSKCDVIDEPNLTVLNLLRTYKECYHLCEMGEDAGNPLISKIHFFTGRTDNFKEQTMHFLMNKCGFDLWNDPYFELVMRPTGDNRHDEDVKREMFDKYIRNKYNVFVMIDDRPRVIRLWHSLGLPVFNVGDGHEF